MIPDTSDVDFWSEFLLYSFENDKVSKIIRRTCEMCMQRKYGYSKRKMVSKVVVDKLNKKFKDKNLRLRNKKGYEDSFIDDTIKKVIINGYYFNFVLPHKSWKHDDDAIKYKLKGLGFSYSSDQSYKIDVGGTEEFCAYYFKFPWVFKGVWRDKIKYNAIGVIDYFTYMHLFPKASDFNQIKELEIDKGKRYLSGDL